MTSAGLTAAVVDAFTSRPFAGNPAAVVLLPGESPAAAGGGSTPPPWGQEGDDTWFLAVAAEFNLSETAFLRPREDGSWGLRWFTPTSEVQLCGHATLASAHWLWERGLVAAEAGRITFRTRSGDLGAGRDGEGRVVVDLPLQPVVDRAEVAGLDAVLGVPHEWVGTTPGARPRDRNGLAVVSATDLIALAPDLGALAGLELGGLIVTARPDPADPEFDGVDVLSRYFAPAFGIPEDPVTGSAHCTLADHWATELGRELLRCRQMSARRGDLVVSRAGGRALVGGHAVTVSDVTLRV
jgi:predicted PhzF superfamily epimerase YddE/YHI9